LKTDDDEKRCRIDKWLWAARFFKTRSLAAQAVDGGKVRLQGERIKPARVLSVGDRLTIHLGEYQWEVTVQRLATQRGPAPVARTLYEESDASRQRRQVQAAARKHWEDPSAVLKGRPTKRDRRTIERLRGS
jgi:ribosome-associated heat shock protein Hsp15